MQHSRTLIVLAAYGLIGSVRLQAADLPAARVVVPVDARPVVITAMRIHTAKVKPEPSVKIRVVACNTRRTIRASGAGSTLCAEVRVTPNAQNRKLRVSWDYAEQAPMGLIGGDDVLPATLGGGEVDGMMGELESDPENGVVGSAEDDLDGAREPILVRPTGYRMETLSGGTYEVTAVVCADADCKQVVGTARTTVRVR
jgi:hypothetical protein